MRISEIIKIVIDDGCKLVRVRNTNRQNGEPWYYDCKDAFTGKKKGWFYFDHFTASAMMTVYTSLKPEHQAKFDNISLPRLLDFTWKSVK